MQVVPQGHYAQQLYDNGAPKGTDKDVSAAIMVSVNNLLKLPPNIPIGPEVVSNYIDHKANTKSALAETGNLFGKQTNGLSTLVLLGEDHTNEEDHERAEDFLAAVNNHELDPTTVVFERGMKYHAPVAGNVVRENNLTTVHGNDFGMGLSAKQRSMVVAGFLVLLHAGGSQNDINKDLIFFGANHSDILKFYDYFAQHTNASYLLKEHRTFMFVRSFVKAEQLQD